MNEEIKKPNDMLKALISLFLGSALLGMSAIFVRYSESSPSLIAFYRAFLALPFLYLWVLIEGKKIDLGCFKNKKLFLLFVIAGFCFAVDMSFWNWSIEYTSVANATLMANTAPLFVSFIGLIFLRHKIKPEFFLILLLAMIGVSLVILSSSNKGNLNVFGDFLGISAAIFYAGYILAIKSLTGRFSPAQTLFLATFMTSLILVPISLFETRDLIPQTMKEWSVLFTYALISQTIAQGLITYGISKITAHLSSLILLIQPLAAAFYGWLLLNEAILPIQAFGGLIVLTSIYLATRKT